MKYLVFLLAIFIARTAPAQEAACPAATAKELQAFFARDDAQETASCVVAAAGVLVRTPDAALARSLLELASSHSGSVADALPFSLARVFSAQPEMFATTLGEIPEATRCGVLDSVERGWRSVTDEVDSQQARSREASLGELRQAHSCHRQTQERAPPSSKQPERYVPRSRRLRWVNLMTPVVNEAFAHRT